MADTGSCSGWWRRSSPDRSRGAVDAIAQRAERTSGSLDGQFGSKDGLIVELLDASKDLVAEAMFADIEAATSLYQRLAALWRNFASPPAAARDWVRFEHEMWVWANRAGNAGPRRDWPSATAASSPPWPWRSTSGRPRA